MLDFDGPAAAKIVDNHDWIGRISFLDALRDNVELPVDYRFRHNRDKLCDAIEKVVDSDFRYDPIRLKFIPVAPSN